jgi:alkylation response protein AidB-like acyl-CoA dehydrogenase
MTTNLTDRETFAEAALRLGGKSETEVRRTGAVDRADEQVEDLFAPRYQTVNSPIHRIVWERTAPVDLFQSSPAPASAECRGAMDRSLETVRQHRAAGTLHDAAGKIPDGVLSDLATAGYWGLLIDPKYGGLGAPFASFARFLTRMATIDATIAGLASVHGCIGAVDPVRTFGNAEQKQRFLPLLASGERLSGFALTEPGAGSDLTALRTRAVRRGDEYLVSGEKLFITNAICGRTIALVCLIDDRPAVLIADLPDREDEHFQLVRYGLYALRHTQNNGLRFRDFAVPAENILVPPRGDGLTIAYHGLNLGRVSLCATAAGNMRVMLASMLPWVKFRRTYGAAIGQRELVRRRLARLAGLIVAADALVEWCAWLLDLGYRGEMECTIAKIFGSEAQKEAAIELCMKTHGGRAFLHGHLFGDNVHEFLAPCIYEGEGEMLSMAFFKSLVKEHGKTYFEPVGRALQQAGLKSLNPANPVHLWRLRGALVPYGKWFVRESLLGHVRPQLPSMPAELQAHADWAIAGLQHMPLEISDVLRRHQLKLADRQCRMSEQSHRVQQLVVMLVSSLYAARSTDDTIRMAADVLCQTIVQNLSGQRPSDAYFKAVNRLGERIADGAFTAVTGIEPAAILMPYDDNSNE